jgi:hypothetical protein
MNWHVSFGVSRPTLKNNVNCFSQDPRHAAVLDQTLSLSAAYPGPCHHIQLHPDLRLRVIRAR